ncbi:hypothetical protein QOT17_004439 [Balamuthia mandrillaris]
MQSDKEHAEDVCVSSEPQGEEQEQEQESRFTKYLSQEYVALLNARKRDEQERQCEGGEEEEAKQRLEGGSQKPPALRQRVRNNISRERSGTYEAMKRLPKSQLLNQLTHYKAMLQSKTEALEQVKQERGKLEEELLECKLLLEDESRQVKSLEAEKNTLERYVTELAEEMERETAQMVQVKQQIVEQVQQQLKLTEEEEDERPTTKKEERDELVVETYPVNSIEQEIERVKRTYDLALPTIDDEEYEEEQDRMERRGRELKRQAWKEERQTQLHNEQEAALKRENEELKRSERELRERVMRAEKELAQMAELRRQQQVELMVKDEHIDICEHEIEELSEKLEVKDKCITVLKKDIARLQEKRKRQKESGRRGEVDILSFAPLSTASRQRHNSVAVLPLSTSSILSNGNAHERNEDEEVEGDDDEVIIRPRRAVSVFASPLSSATSNSSSPIASSASSSSWLEGSHSQKRSPSSPVSNFRLGSRSSPPSASPTPSSASSPRLANERSDTISSFWEQLWK